MTSQKTFRRGFWLIACSSVAWGTSGLSFQMMYAISDTNALSLAFWRLAIATPLFLLSGWLVLDRGLFHIKRRDFWVMLLMGGLQASYQASFTVGSIVTLCEPLTASLLATFFLHETLHATGLLGAALLLGALVLFLLAPRK